MTGTTHEILEFIKENEVKFIRLGFCDLFGFHKNISIMADGLQSAFENGVSFDAHAISGFRGVTRSDLFLFPDPSTLTALPWRPGPGRVAQFFCDVKNPDGTEFPRDGRALLKRVVRRCKEMGYSCKIGAECEFYLFKADEEGEPTSATFDKGGYLDVAPPLDKGGNIRREICLALEEMGIKPETSHHEQGPGQNEIDFEFGGALTCADNFLTFKTAVKAIAARNGLFASFCPKPILNAPGNGMHVNVSLLRNGDNIFGGAQEGNLSAADGFIAGILDKTPEITAFLNPTANSYERLGKFEAPKYVSWSHQNRSQLIRIPAAAGEKMRMELRSPDPSLNPYLAFALIISAGLDGMENGAALPPPVDADLYAADGSLLKTLVPLPESLGEAVALAENSEFAKGVLGEETFSKYLSAKRGEAADFAATEYKEEFYKERYFGVI
ncbi:MAG: glutamine synthetase family protein [Oscillospiraceae bacterium]|jgi:glutamine synthetase|nr:glutamine synthetase family protein [Oscillospiraceae bacterium]